MSAIKEPHFFNFDVGRRKVRNLRDYEHLFARVQSQHLAIGEATPKYLYSRVAVTAIRRYAPDARMIVLLRNPIDMTHALHQQRLFSGDESETDFDRAWQLQKQRLFGHYMPHKNIDPQVLWYGEICKLGNHVARLVEAVPARQLLLIRFDELQVNPDKVYSRVTSFLGLPDWKPKSFTVLNASKQPRFPRLHWLLHTTNRTLNSIGVPHIRLGLTEYLQSLNRTPRARPPISSELRQELREYFREDIALLQSITGWDLGNWR